MPNNCAAIVIAAKHHELTKVKDTRGTTHTVGALRCRFDFRTEDWEHSAKTAMFCKGDALLHPEVADNAIAVPLDGDDECAVPYEVLVDELPYSVGVWGVTDSGLRIVSRWLVFGAQLGCYTDGNAPADPEPTIYEQILSTAQQAVNAADAVTERADSGEFDGASAYQIAVNQGYEGTEAEWIESLVGDDGVGIIKSEINASGELVLTYSNGNIINLGVVVGKDGNYVVVDDAMSPASTNPVQNRVVYMSVDNALNRANSAVRDAAQAKDRANEAYDHANEAGAEAYGVKQTIQHEVNPRLTAVEDDVEAAEKRIGAVEGVIDVVNDFNADIAANRNRIAAAEGEIDELQETIKGLSSAMHFEGVVSSDPTATGFNVANYKTGDVVVFGNKEFVFVNGKFAEFGDATGNASAISAMDGRVKALEGVDHDAAHIATLQSAKDYADELVSGYEPAAQIQIITWEEND